LGLPRGAVWAVVHQVMPQLFPRMNDVYARYDAAVTALAGLDPLLAFVLRSKDLLGILPGLSATIATADEQAAAMLPQIGDFLMSKAIPALDKAALLLAWRHSTVTWIRTRRKINEKLDLAELTALLKSLKPAATVGGAAAG